MFVLRPKTLKKLTLSRGTRMEFVYGDQDKYVCTIDPELFELRAVWFIRNTELRLVSALLYVSYFLIVKLDKND